MPNIPFADEIHAFLEDEENVEALTEAVQELNNICINGTSGLPPRGIFIPDEWAEYAKTQHGGVITAIGPNGIITIRPKKS